jgi:SAM-dependent methyltransferase
MFAPDVISLRQFYATPFGGEVRKLIARSIMSLWPQAPGDVVVGIGYCTPYFEPYLEQANPLVICMPAQQGAAYWPPTGNNRVLLAHESELPFAENSVNRILLLHSFENTEQLSWMIQEMWRVLTPGGRILAVVPNRLGLWSRSSRSPFGHGRPFSMTQLRDLMTNHQFTLTQSSSALFMPPTYWRLLWKLASKVEILGKFACPFIGGVLLVEAEKQVYASLKQPVAARKAYASPIPASNPVLGRFTPDPHL